MSRPRRQRAFGWVVPLFGAGVCVVHAAPAGAQTAQIEATGGEAGASAQGGAAVSLPSSRDGAGGKVQSTAEVPGNRRGGRESTGSADPAVAAVVEAETDADRWRERDRKLGESVSVDGSVGLLRTRHAQGGAAGQFRLQFLSEFFSSGFLCRNDYPCQSPGRAGRSLDDSMSRVGGTLALGVGITKWLEGYAALSARATSDAANDPSLIQVLGDTVLGLKAFVPVAGKVLWLGGAADLWLLNGTGSVGLAGDATSAKLHALSTLDFRQKEKPFPLRASLNVTYSLDNSGALASSTETVRQTSITRIERFSLGINRVDHVDLKLGLEAFFAKEHLRPFVEYGLDIPVNRQGFECRLDNPSGDGCLANNAVAPSRLTLGTRVLPWKRGFSLTAALDIGVTGVGKFIEEVRPEAPWTLWLGGGWAIDTQDRPAPVTRVVAAAGAEGRVSGNVVDKESGVGIADAIVTFANHPEHTSLATAADGGFRTDVLQAGDYRFTVRAAGFKPGECSVLLGKGGPSPWLTCHLEAEAKVAAVVGKIHDEAGIAVTRASVVLKSGDKRAETTSGDDGSFRFAELPPGATSLEVEAEGYFPASQSFETIAAKEVSVDVELHARPASSNVTVGAREIVIKQQIQFGNNSAQILPQSTTLLEEIADVLRSTPRVRKLEVQGHTDNTGKAERNLTLSDERAAAVRDWLVAHGVAADRLTAKGYGQSRPLVPNVTATNRARNRRVQFVILEQDAAPGKEPAKKTGKLGLRSGNRDDSVNLRLHMDRPGYPPHASNQDVRKEFERP